MDLKELTEAEKENLTLLLSAYKRALNAPRIQEERPSRAQENLERIKKGEPIERRGREDRQQRVPRPNPGAEFFADIIRSGIEEVLDKERTLQIAETKKAVEETDLKLTELMRRSKDLNEAASVARKNRKSKILKEVYP